MKPGIFPGRETGTLINMDMGFSFFLFSWTRFRGENLFYLSVQFPFQSPRNDYLLGF